MFRRTLKYLAPTIGVLLMNPPMIAVAEDVQKDGPPQKPKCKKQCKNEHRTELEKCIDSCRKECGPVKSAVITYVKEMSCLAKSFRTAVKSNVDFLRNCNDPDIQYGGVIVGGAIGALLGFRRSIIRKIFYGAIGGAAMYSVIWPDDALCYSKQGFQLLRKYGQEGYNFVVGQTGSASKQCPEEPAKKPKCQKHADCPAKREYCGRQKECPPPKKECLKKKKCAEQVKPLCPPAQTYAAYEQEPEPLVYDQASQGPVYDEEPQADCGEYGYDYKPSQYIGERTLLEHAKYIKN